MAVFQQTEKLAPIVMIVFNRPDHTGRVLQALSENVLASESKLYIFSDAPRGPQDVEAVAAVRALIHQASGFNQLTIVEREHNYGCDTNVPSAVSEVLQKHDKCIILEDDVMPYSLFLTYMNEALTVYDNDPTVFSIGAYTHAFKMPVAYQKETFLLYRSCSWGWGTWKSAWETINLDQKVLDRAMANPSIRKQFAESGEDLIRTYERSPESWDLRVCFQEWSLGLKTLFPVQSMTRNIGRDGSGTHYNQGAPRLTDIFQEPTRIPILLPPLKEVDMNVRMAYNRPLHKPMWRRVGIKLTKFLGLYDTLVRWSNAR